jgi:hypothetical protein
VIQRAPLNAHTVTLTGTTSQSFISGAYDAVDVMRVAKAHQSDCYRRKNSRAEKFVLKMSVQGSSSQAGDLVRDGMDDDRRTRCMCLQHG